ncbi:MAG: YobA family protein [Clostridia bacterium]|nr:YobA family protein [Clostridia bacterium]
MRKTIIIVGIIIILFVAGYLLYDTVGFNSMKVDIRGTVTNVSQISNGVIILVEGNLEPGTMVDKASIRLDSNTKVVMNSKKYSYEDISVGDKVEVEFKGPVAESYPVQASAKYINILAKGSE